MLGGPPAGVPRAMEPLLLLWLVVAGASTRLLCPEGQPCPPTPVSARGRGGGTGGCLQLVGNPHSPCPLSPPPPGQVLCPDGSPCPAGASCPLPEVSHLPCLSFPDSLQHLGGGCPPPHSPPIPTPLPAQGVSCAGGHRCCPQGSLCSADGESCVTSPGTGGWAHVAGVGGHGCTWGVPSPRLRSPQPSELSLVPTDSPSVPIMPRAA